MIGIVITREGSICDFRDDNYIIEDTASIIDELQEIDRFFHQNYICLLTIFYININVLKALFYLWQRGRMVGIWVRTVVKIYYDYINRKECKLPTSTQLNSLLAFEITKSVRVLWWCINYGYVWWKYREPQVLRNNHFNDEHE